jgi:hypothetical protein
MIIKSNSIILATDLSPAFMPVSEFASYKKGLYPLAIVNSLSFNVQNSRIQKKQLSSQSLSVNALQYSPTVDVSFNYTSSLAFENENFLGIYFKAYEDYTSSFLKANDHSCNLYFIISDLYANDLIKNIQTRGNLNGLTTIAFGNCSLSNYSLSLGANDLPSVSAQMQAVNMTMSTISSSLISTPAINLNVGDQIGAAQLPINNTLFIEHLQRLNTQSGNFPILPTRDSLYFQITSQNLQVPSVKISPSEDSAITSLELSFGIDRENSYGFGSNFIYDSKIKYPILGNLSLSATSLNLHTGDGSLTGSMSSEQDYSLELMFSGVNENSKFIKINNAKLESHSYQMDYAGMLSAQYAFNFECNEATGMAVKWGQVAGASTGILLSFENLQLRSSDGSGIGFLIPPQNYTYVMGYSADYSYFACSFGNQQTVYSSDNPLSNASVLYQDDYLTMPVIDGFYSISGNYYVVQEGGGSILNSGACPTVYSHQLGYEPNNTLPVTSSCTVTPRQPYYSSSALNNGTVLYTTPELIGPVSEGSYSDGGTAYLVNSEGAILSVVSCTIPPTTPPPTTPPPTTPPPPPPPTTPPPPPSVGPFSFSLGITSGPSVNINWSFAENATSYSVFKSEDDVSFSQIYNTSTEPFFYNDSNVLGGGVGTPNYYYYYMTADSGVSNYTTSSQLIGVE